MSTTIDNLKAQAAKYEKAAATEAQMGKAYNYDATPAVDGLKSLAAMLLEAIGKADTMTEAEFEKYAAAAINAAWQWEDTIGPNADADYFDEEF